MKALFIEVFVVVIFGVFSVSEGIRLVLAKKLHNYDILGPGFYNVGLGSVLILVGLIYFVSEWKKTVRVEKKAAVTPFPEKSEYQKMISMIAVMTAYIFLIYLTGYLFASLVFFILINRIAGFRSGLTIVGVSVLMTASFYIVFVTWMGIIFPKGLLFHL